MTASATESAPNLREDQRGAIMIAGVFMCGILCGFLWYLIGIGNAILYRESLQDSTDALAFTGAVFHAHGMEIIVLLNLIMTALVAVLVILRAIETILIGIIVVCTVLTAIPWTAAFGGSCLSFANPARANVTRVGNNYDKNVLAKVLPKLNAAARGMSFIFPWIAEGKTVAHGARLSRRNVYNGGIRVGAMLSESLLPKGVDNFKVGLPIEEDTSTFKDRTGPFMDQMMKSFIPGAFGSLLGAVFGKGANILGFRAHLSRGHCDGYTNECGEKAKPIKDEGHKYKASDFRGDVKKACDKGKKSCETKGNTFTFEADDVKEVNGKYESQKVTQTKSKTEMDDCNERAEDPVDKRCDENRFTGVPVTCPTMLNSKNERVPNPNYDRSHQPRGVYECWDRRDECSTTDKNGARFKVDGQDTDIHGRPIEKLVVWRFDHGACMKREMAKVQKKLNEMQDSGSGSGGKSNNCEGPKKLYCKIEHAGDTSFAVYATAVGKPPNLRARGGVGVPAPNVKDKGLNALAKASELGTAQAEFYYAGKGWADQALWNFRWQARLRFFHVPEKLNKFLSKVGNAISKLEGAVNAKALLEDRAAFLVNCTRNCVGAGVDSKCMKECVSVKLELPINRFQSIH